MRSWTQEGVGLQNTPGTAGVDLARCAGGASCPSQAKPDKLSLKGFERTINWVRLADVPWVMCHRHGKQERLNRCGKGTLHPPR